MIPIGLRAFDFESEGCFSFTPFMRGLVVAARGRTQLRLSRTRRIRTSRKVNLDSFCLFDTLG